MFNLNILKYTIDHVELFYKPRKKMKKKCFFFSFFEKYKMKQKVYVRQTDGQD